MAHVSLRIVSVFGLLFSLLQPSAQAAPLPIEHCKLSAPSYMTGTEYPHQPQNDSVRIYFPSIPHRLPNSGSHSQLIVAVDFPDARFPFRNVQSYLEILSQPKIISEFYETMSYGKVKITFDVYPEVITLSKPFSHYLNDKNKPYSVENIVQSGVVMEETRDILQSRSVLQKYSGLNIVETGMKAIHQPNQGVAAGTPSVSGFSKAFYNITLVYGSLFSEGKMVPALFEHEIGHLFGFIDIYNVIGTKLIDLIHHPFDLMASTSFGLGAWNRWLMGWVTDPQILCVDSTTGVHEVSLSPINLADDGLKAVIIKLSPNKVLIVESRRTDSYDKFGYSMRNYKGVVLHELDISSFPGRGAMKVYDGEEWVGFASKTKEDTDSLYATQVTETGEYLYYKPSNILIENLRSDGISDLIRISLGESALTNLKSAKAVAELEAKAAVELKAKQEAEAKAAAELKAKDEAKAVADKLIADAKVEAARILAAVKAAATKKTTITCIKGKLTKKVTAVKPRCPAGYKVKK